MNFEQAEAHYHARQQEANKEEGTIYRAIEKLQSENRIETADWIGLNGNVAAIIRTQRAANFALIMYEFARRKDKEGEFETWLSNYVSVAEQIRRESDQED